MTIRVSFDRRLLRAANLLSAAMIGGGFAALLGYAWIRVDEAAYQAAQKRYFPLETEAASLAGTGSATIAPHGLPQATAARTFSWTRPDPGVIGRLMISRLDLDVIVRNGVDDATLRRAVGHIPSTSLPGDPGNFAVAGHRDTFFRPLRHIRNGDEIRVVTSTGEHRYAVYAISVVGPDHVQALQPTEQPECTLITCFPFDYTGPAGRRFIVQARLISQSREPVRVHW